ncbi:MAG: hypothetical protein KDA87_00795 [Planctomycetales bacterium]|nr:hypothetical protein [Planctomycetales bacterium]
MKLTFVRPHASINSLNEIDLPKFTLLTGINGSGKTHLLQCILGGHVTTNVATANKTEVRYFDWSSMIPNASAQEDVNTTLAQRSGFLNTFRAHLPKFEQTVMQTAQQNGLPANALTSPRQIARLTVADLQTLLGDRHRAEQAYAEIRQAMQNASACAIRKIGNNSQTFQFFQDLEAFVGLPVGAATDEEIDSLPLTLGTVDVFKQSFANLFLS